MRSSNLLAIPTLRVDELKKSRHSSGAAAAASVADEESGECRHPSVCITKTLTTSSKVTAPITKGNPCSIPFIVPLLSDLSLCTLLHLLGTLSLGTLLIYGVVE